jgi:hypothetical protein
MTVRDDHERATADLAPAPYRSFFDRLLSVYVRA